MKNIAILGAGASGLAAAVTVAGPASVCVYEQKNMAGKKLLATGNGKCNLLNEDQSLMHFHSQNPDLVEDILSGVSFEEIKDFFAGLGILTVSRNGYMYPMSEQAKSVQKALVDAAKERGVKFEFDTEISSIERIDDRLFTPKKEGSSYKSEGSDKPGAFKLKSADGREFFADIVILATGTRAGSRAKEDLGVTLAKSLGHSFIPYSPALCALKIDSKMCAYWQGVRTKAEISLILNGKTVRTEMGELMLTDYGVSGIPAFQLSGYITSEEIKQGEADLNIDWLPSLDKSEITDFLDGLDDTFKERNLAELLYGVLPGKLADTLINEACHRYAELNGFKSHSLKWSDLGREQRECILNALKCFVLKVSGLNNFESVQVCAGGIPLTEIDTKSCESKCCEELFITGEMLDVNGDCGGYNLQWAWTTGILAGRACACN